MINRRHAFTLVEIMIATALVALVLTVVYGTWRLTLDGSQRCQTRLTLWREAQSLSSRLNRQLAGALPDLDGPTGPVRAFIADSNPAAPTLRFLTRCSLLSDNSNGGLILASWMTGSDGLLYYQEQPFIHSDELKATPQLDNYIPLSVHPVKLNLLWIDNLGQSSLQWGNRAESAPRQVQVTLTVMDSDNPNRGISIQSTATIRTESQASFNLKTDQRKEAGI